MLSGTVNIFLHFVVCLLPPTPPPSPPPSPPPHLSQCCEGCAVPLWRCGPGGGRLVCGGTISLHYWYGSSARTLSLILSSPCPSVPPSPSPCTSCPHSFPSPPLPTLLSTLFPHSSPPFSDPNYVYLSLPCSPSLPHTETNTWTVQNTSGPAPRALSMSGVLCEGKMITFGGVLTGKGCNSVHILDIGELSFSSLSLDHSPPLPPSLPPTLPPLLPFSSFPTPFPPSLTLFSSLCNHSVMHSQSPQNHSNGLKPVLTAEHLTPGMLEQAKGLSALFRYPD